MENVYYVLSQGTHDQPWFRTNLRMMVVPPKTPGNKRQRDEMDTHSQATQLLVLAMDRFLRCNSKGSWFK